MRAIARSLRSRLAKMEGSCRVDEFDQMSMDELQNYCDRETLECLSLFDGNINLLMNSIKSNTEWPLRDLVVCSYQHHLDDMHKRGLLTQID